MHTATLSTAELKGQHLSISMFAAAVGELSNLTDALTLNDGAITNGSHIFTSASAIFAPSAVGKIIWVYGAGVAGALLSTTISGVTNTHTITLTSAASTTVAGAVFSYGTDVAPAFSAALIALNTNGGGRLLIPRGQYLIGSTLPLFNTTLELSGDGSFNPANFYTLAAAPGGDNRGTVLFVNPGIHLFTPHSGAANYFDSTQIHLKNFTVYGGSGIVALQDVATNADFLYAGLKVFNQSGTSIEIGATDGTGATNGNVFFTRVEGCHFFEVGIGILNHSNCDLTVERSFFWNHRTRALEIRGANTRIKRNTIISKYGATSCTEDILLYPTFYYANGGGVYDIVIDSNKFGVEEATAGEGRVKIRYGTTAQKTANPTFPCENVRVTNNTFFCPGGSSDAIALHSPTKHCLWSDNTYIMCRYAINDSTMDQTVEAFSNVWRDNILSKQNAVKPQPFASGGFGFTTIVGSDVEIQIDDGMQNNGEYGIVQNLIFPSEDWTGPSANATITLGQSDPLGGTGAALATRTAAAGLFGSWIAGSGICTSDGAQTFSFWAKAGTLIECVIQLDANTGAQRSIRYLKLTSQWRRYSLRILGMSIGTQVNFTIFLGDVKDPAQVGNLYLFGAQLNSGDTPNPYLKTPVGFSITLQLAGAMLTQNLTVRGHAVVGNVFPNPAAVLTVDGAICSNGDVFPTNNLVGNLGNATYKYAESHVNNSFVHALGSSLPVKTNASQQLVTAKIDPHSAADIDTSAFTQWAIVRKNGSIFESVTYTANRVLKSDISGNPYAGLVDLSASTDVAGAGLTVGDVVKWNGSNLVSIDANTLAALIAPYLYLADSSHVLGLDTQLAAKAAHPHTHSDTGHTHGGVTTGTGTSAAGTASIGNDV